MIEVVVDYRNLQFCVYEDGRLTMDNPLPVEVQRAVIQKIIAEVAENFRQELRGQITSRPPGLDDILLH